jgi:hypothetical protein
VATHEALPAAWEFAYIEADIPPDMTLAEFRRARATETRAARRRLRDRARLLWPERQRFAYSLISPKSTQTHGSSPITSASWPGGIAAA